MPFFVVLVNVFAVGVGSLLGMLLGDKMPLRLKNAILHTLGLGTLIIGAQLALAAQNMILVIGSALIGVLIGTALDLEGRMEKGAEMLKMAVKADSPVFVEGFVSASLLFCVGPMTFLGSIQNGLGDSDLLLMKSMLDGFAAIALASALGMGVLFSAITVCLVQGSLTFLGAGLGSFAESAAAVEFNAVGGLLIIGIGLGLLEIKKLPMANLLPALAVVIPLAKLIEHFADK